MVRQKDPFSTVYALFGSENVWSKENIQEIAHGIELSNVNFLWVLRFLGSEVEQLLPDGFLNRVKEKGWLFRVGTSCQNHEAHNHWQILESLWLEFCS
ncbi:flavanone 7-o-glucoside 2''-o-beta-l-rhamnosyltransferase [Nicotiana attenuata]|uniref:Flavanone 7-o-glucoside 2''-o-beta-l-rhamnosyltransferase n=1 Tax=Nicotiana attenuata TaxID=49451 RepID=A0A314KQZ9_NICAT|nr:flavanone 7-o-glucoside 2''-o-beta-l-rhamnosyltransferase [Nicotiana attenuata]